MKRGLNVLLVLILFCLPLAAQARKQRPFNPVLAPLFSYPPINNDTQTKTTTNQAVPVSQPVSMPEVMPSESSWVPPLNAQESKQWSEIITQLIQTQLPPSSQFCLADLPALQANNAFLSMLKTTLNSHGYKVEASSSSLPRVRYRVLPLQHKTWLVRLKINTTELSTVYQRGRSGSLVALSPLCVTQGENL